MERTTKCWAASSSDGWIKVKIHSLDADWSVLGKRRAREDVIDFAFPSFPYFFADLVDGQRRARSQFEGRFWLCEFNLASGWEKGRCRRRIRRRNEIKRKLDSRLVIDVI